MVINLKTSLRAKEII